MKSFILGILFCVIGVCISYAETIYYVTDESRETKQVYVEEDWPIVKEWNIQLIWVDSDVNIVGLESGGKCGSMEFKTTKYINKENFKDCEYIGHKYHDCNLFYKVLKRELER